MTTVNVPAGSSFTVPAGVTLLSVQVIGGGGGGGGGSYSYYGRGGSAGQVVSQNISVTPGQVIPVQGGGGGGGGAAGTGGKTCADAGQPGSPGTTTTFGGVSATGGAGGGGGVRGGCGTSTATSLQNGATNGTIYGAGGRGGYSIESAGGGVNGVNGSNGGVVITYVILTPTITADVTAGAAPLDVSFTGGVAGGSATAYDWNFGDGTAHAGTQNTTHQYTIVGQKTVTFTVTGTYGSWSTTATVTVYWQPSAHVFVISSEQWRR